MTGRSGATRLATVLFLDVVGSTRIAAEMGDEGWRSTLTRFRRLVRVQLKAFDGREEDTAGDGFFATFTQPASAIRCAASIIRDVQAIGIDVRCGIHISGVGTIEGRPGGMGVHVGARLMALAGPAEILCTTTVRELILGSNIEFAERGSQALRDVPGEWQVLAVSRTPRPLPPKLEPEEARDRWESAALADRRRMPLVLLGSAVVIVVLAGTIIALGTRDQPPPSRPLSRPAALVRIDPATNKISQRVGRRPGDTNVVYDAVDGLLWQAQWTLGRLIHRNVADGSDPFVIEYESQLDPAFGFGSAWTYEPGDNATTMEVTRYAEASGTPTTFTVEGSPMTAVYANAYRAFVRGEDGIWYVSGSDTRLHLIDPTSNQDRSFPTGSWDLYNTGPTEVLPAGDSVWICGEIDEVVKRFDVPTHRVEDNFPVDNGNCPVAVTGDSPRRLWILDRVRASLSEIDGKTGERLGGPYGIGPSFEASSGLWGVGFSSLWFPAGDTLYRFNIHTKRTTAIRMPTGVSAATVVIDEETRAVWVGNCAPANCSWLRE